MAKSETSQVPSPVRHRTVRTMLHNGSVIPKGHRIPDSFDADLIALHLKDGNIRPETPQEAADAANAEQAALDAAQAAAVAAGPGTPAAGPAGSTTGKPLTPSA